MSRSKGEVHDNVPSTSSGPVAGFELCRLGSPDVAVKDTMRTEACVKRTLAWGSGLGATLLRLDAVESDGRRGMVTERRMIGSEFFRTCILSSVIAVELKVGRDISSCCHHLVCG